MRKVEPRDVTSSEGKQFLEAFNEGSQKVYKSGLGVFLVFFGHQHTLADLLDLLDEDQKRSRREKKFVGRQILKDFSKWLKKKKFEPKSIRTYVSSVQSFATYWGYSITARYINLPTSQPVSQKYPWKVNEAYEFIKQLPTLELQSIAVTTFQSGLGPADILGLTWNDIKIEFEKETVPLCFDFGRKKTDVPFMTFIGKWGLSLLKEHLKGKRLQLRSPLYTINDRMIRLHFLKLGKRKLGEWIGLNPCRLYSLRAAFRTILGDAGLEHDYAEFFMGHHVAEQRRVYVSKSRDGWRQTYHKYEPYLTPSK